MIFGFETQWSININRCVPIDEIQISDCKNMHAGISPKILSGVQYSTVQYLFNCVNYEGMHEFYN